MKAAHSCSVLLKLDHYTNCSYWYYIIIIMKAAHSCSMLLELDHYTKCSY